MSKTKEFKKNDERTEKADNRVLKSRQILFLFDARDCNPNGERESGIDGPRIDPITGKAIITDVSFKFLIRDYFLKSSTSKSDHILMRQSLKYKNGKEISIKQYLLNVFGLSKAQLKKKSKKEIITLIENRFIDHRLFGSIFYIQGDLHSVMGPVQFQNTLSLNSPRKIDIPITSVIASESGKGQGSMGKYYIIDYSIFPVYGIIKNSLAEISGAKEKDFLKLIRGMWIGIQSQTTRTKFQQLPRLLISIVPKDNRFQIPEIRNVIELNGSAVSVFKDCTFNLEKFINIIKNHKDKIEKVEYKEDQDISYSYKGKELHSISDIAKFIENPPEFNLIQF